MTLFSTASRKGVKAKWMQITSPCRQCAQGSAETDGKDLRLCACDTFIM